MYQILIGQGDMEILERTTIRECSQSVSILGKCWEVDTGY